MGEYQRRRRGILPVAAVIALAGLVAACAPVSTDPAPVVLKGAALGVPGDAAGAPAPAARPGGEARRIVVRSGQSLTGIARTHHVSKHAIIAANHLTPPYDVRIGQHLIIPGGAEAPVQQQTAALPSAAPTEQRHPPPEIIPLDGPAPARTPPAPQNAANQVPVVLKPYTPPSADASAPAKRPPAEPSAAREARAEPAVAPRGASPKTSEAAPGAVMHGGHFAWPVRGRVLAGYGVASGGSHNDGINIAAPRGTPVAAVDAGVVAYAGNELRGYGNLVLVKHANGFITAYAHCDELLVKQGDKVNRGQAIAKVGATGGVSEPQLHFELRRGKKAVDPREFLAPAPSAGEDRSVTSG
jgi:murein DD-endopeptidase MepM/ murein hydrolase activator NlpD